MKTIHHVLDIDAPGNEVWSALTEADRMARWWSTVVRTPPAAVGALVEWTFAGDFNPTMEIIRLDAPDQLDGGASRATSPGRTMTSASS